MDVVFKADFKIVCFTKKKNKWFYRGMLRKHAENYQMRIRYGYVPFDFSICDYYKWVLKQAKIIEEINRISCNINYIVIYSEGSDFEIAKGVDSIMVNGIEIPRINGTSIVKCKRTGSDGKEWKIIKVA